MVEIMRNYYNECKRCNENISEEKVNKKIQMRKTNIINLGNEYLSEIRKLKKEFQKLENKVGKNQQITGRIEVLEAMMEIIENIQKLASNILCNNKRFNCEDCKNICGIEYLQYSLSEIMINYNTAGINLATIMDSLFSQIVANYKDEEIDRRIKEILEDKGYYQKLSIRFGYLTYQIRCMVKTIVEEQICLNIPENERKQLLEDFKQDSIEFNNWLCKQNIMKGRDNNG